MELFNSSQFSSKNDALRDFEVENVSSKKKALKRSQPKLDPAWDDGSAFPEVSSKNIFFSQGETLKAIEEKGLVDGAAPLPKDFDSFKEFEVAWKDWIVKQTGTSEEELCCVSASYVWEQELSTIKDDNDNESDRPKSQAETKTSPKSKASDCWYTPPEIITLIQQCLDGITLDPCSDERKHIEACRHLTALDNGLSHQWFGRVFMNPPYSCPGVWIAKLQEEFNSGRVEEAIALVPVATDTKWFHPLIASNLICFWKGRIKFLDINYQPKMAARQSHCLIYWGKNQPRFRQVFSSFGSFNFLEDKEAIAECNNSHNLTFAQGLAQDSPLPQQSSEDSSLLESQKSMITAVAFSQSDSPVSATTVTCEVSQCEISENSGEKSTLLQLRHHVSPSQSRESDLEKKTPATVSPQSNEPLNQSDPNSSALKTCQDCSIAHLDQGGQRSIFSTSYARLPDSAMMRNGCVSVQEPLEVPLLESDYYWLESPGALSNGKGRPPGLTKQEAGLKNLGVIKSGQVVNPEFLESSYALPLGWTDPQEERSALELLAEMELSEVAALPSETPLTGELPPLDLAESSTSTQLLSTQEIIEALSISEDELDEFWNNEPALFKGFKIQWLGATIQKWRLEPNTFLKDKLPQSESIPEKFLEDKNQLPSIESLSLSSIESNTTPEKFLEESTADTKQLPPQKRRQRKGCLYKYLENKKLKNGNIASYPRVIGETRDPDNPKHWRWGFNWEEKIDGEWKGRSIGSVPIGAIPFIQSMQRENIKLEEIIGFIKRSKAKP